MAIHQDDPPWDIFGLPRLLVDAESIDRFLTMVDDPYNCLTLCSGSMNANPNNNVAAIVRKHCDRIPFAHVRNIHHFENGDFSEAAHRDCCGETGIIEILRAYHDCGTTAASAPTTAASCGGRPRQLPPRLRQSTTAPSACSTCSASGTCWIVWTKRRTADSLPSSSCCIKTKSRCASSGFFVLGNLRRTVGGRHARPAALPCHPFSLCFVGNVLAPLRRPEGRPPPTIFPQKGLVVGAAYMPPAPPLSREVAEPARPEGFPQPCLYRPSFCLPCQGRWPPTAAERILQPPFCPPCPLHLIHQLFPRAKRPRVLHRCDGDALQRGPE